MFASQVEWKPQTQKPKLKSIILHCYIYICIRFFDNFPFRWMCLTIYAFQTRSIHFAWKFHHFMELLQFDHKLFIMPSILSAMCIWVALLKPYKTHFIYTKAALYFSIEIVHLISLLDNSKKAAQQFMSFRKLFSLFVFFRLHESFFSLLCFSIPSSKY